MNVKYEVSTTKTAWNSISKFKLWDLDSNFIEFTRVWKGKDETLIIPKSEILYINQK